MSKPASFAPRIWLGCATLAAACALGACSPKGDINKPATKPKTVVQPTAGELRLVRLTRAQYANTLHDLIGEDESIANDLPFDTVGESGFYEPGSAGAREVRGYMELAEQVANRAAPRLNTLAGCDTADEAGCARPFLAGFARRAYRRPLLDEETRDLDRLYNAFRQTQGYPVQKSMQLTLATLLQSPSFLYRWEQGPTRVAPDVKSGLVALSAHERAARLSYFLWNTMPDAELSEAADSGDLMADGALAAQAERMMADPRARATVYDFHGQWLGIGDVGRLEKDIGVYPKWNELLRDDIAHETRAFLDYVFTEGDGTVETLFGANFTFVNKHLGTDVYGLKGGTDDVFEKKALNAAQRFGLMTQASFLATHAYAYDSAPVKRGLAVRERLLCQPVQPPPPALMVTPPLPDPTLSVRQQFAQHSDNPSCAGCHTLLDPVGFAFENYDGIGKYRTTSGPAAVDASGTLTGVGTTDIPFNNAAELMQTLRGSSELRQCVATQWTRYALGRMETPADKPSFDSAFAAFQAANFDVRAFIYAFVETPAFKSRAVAAGEQGVQP